MNWKTSGNWGILRKLPIKTLLVQLSLSWVLGGLLFAHLPALADNDEFSPFMRRPGTKTITLLAVNDVYRLLPANGRGGLAELATLIKRIEAESPETTRFVLAGDTLSPSVESKLFQGRQMVAVWNALGLDVATLGNHEFDYGGDVLKKRMSESRFPWLAANVFDAKTGQPFHHMPAYLLETLDGVKVGFFGLLTPDTVNISKAKGVVRIDDPIATARPLVKQLREAGAQVVVAVTHLTLPEDKRLAAEVPDIDLILGGHEHTLLQSLSGRTPIFKMASDAVNLGRIQLNLDAATGRLLDIDWQVLPVDSQLPADPAVAQTIAEFEQQVRQAMETPLLTLAVPLDVRQSQVRTRETAVGNWFADCYRQVFGSEIAFVNGGSLRSNRIYPEGPFTVADLNAILPFDNTVRVVSVPGATLRQALEHSIASLSDGTETEPGRFLQVSGLTFAYEPSKPAGQRVSNIQVHGQPLQEKRRYTLTTSDFLLQGGNDYTMFAPVMKAVPRSRAAMAEADVIREALAQRSATGPISPATANRITRLDAR
jgi:5'-nucleotidase